ncbi:carbamoyltransferase HypF [Vitiosangium sp. GDMCC 1.1324]|uniref:carbamoyltransferase HypF n=1 Tax=Vitiosangium sp. (strain GDMCC 1.1324) TaxID=2138576 RepID=UPI000D388461|nr:carbamoyltransferase HypF [Vitiosangium sp. GDMCC 1.1324]PTL82467.1 carbamoyltransferase HypF [Vitiosangium sp. GDMCC 1.1324]
MVRRAITVHGVVQGVGFRPFVHAAATARGLAGWVRNRADGVRIEVEGPAPAVEDFVKALACEAPPAACLTRVNVSEVPPRHEHAFLILDSDPDAPPQPTVPADLATCPECLEEVAAFGERRFRYPFTNCTRCGPRWTLIESLPYDRPRTSMKRFVPCADCEAEYRDPGDRRFHAQPIACPTCGPRVSMLASDGSRLAEDDAALRGAAETLREGRVLALRGLGGFHLLVDATSPEAVALLRQRKRRPEKPFAVMFPSLQVLRSCCEVSPEEAAVLTSPAAPILLLRRRASGGAAVSVAETVAPGNPWLGALLPYTPLHGLLLEAVGRPLVCTSGNLSDEPLCIDSEEALARLHGVADRFLIHDRPIVRPVDDSVARLTPEGLQVLRRARGYAPLPLPLPGAPCLLGLGGQLKGTVALCVGEQVVVSQHLGDLGSLEGARLLERTVADLLRLLEARPVALACDLHPDYASSRLAERLSGEWGVPLMRVQHHHAHVAACVAEHGLSGPVLGLAWDGAGLGTDGALWGGEALVVEGAGFRRVAHLRPFSLPGGERALREPRRAALGLLHEVDGAGALMHLREAFAAREGEVLVAMLDRGLQSPRTTSMGRLFDAVATLSGIRAQAGFEGQAAMALEFAAGEGEEDPYPLPLGDGVPAVADWEPLVRALLSDRTRGVPPPLMAARFHAALAVLAESIAVRVGLPRVVLSGGCFQNLRLLRNVQARLRTRGIEVLWPRQYPPNDGGLSLGQVAVAARWFEEEHDVSRHPR